MSLAGLSCGLEAVTPRALAQGSSALEEAANSLAKLTSKSSYPPGMLLGLEPEAGTPPPGLSSTLTLCRQRGNF